MNAAPAQTDTIAAIASPPGHSARAIVRIAGPQTPAILARLCQDAPDRTGPCTVRLPGGAELACEIVRWTAPRSYTAQDAAELILPGNPELARRVLRALCGAGAREAGPGEFTLRACLAGKLTVEQAEGVARVIASERDDELETARRLLRGDTGERYARWADRIAELLALVEAGIDFTDQEDVVPIEAADLRARLLKLRAEIRDLIGAPGERRSASPRAVLAGPPSAGKSTLFNALLGRERAVVHDRPGTTRDAIAEPLKLDTRTVTLVDLAGLEAAGDADAQAAAFSEIKAADLVLWCDPDGSPPDERLEPAKTICIRTKADRPIGEPDADVVEVCALDGRGLAVLRGVLAEHALAGSAGLSVPERHAEALRATEARLESACTELAGQERALASPELVAGELRLGLDSLGAITGRVDADEILGRVFSGFCVGK